MPWKPNYVTVDALKAQVRVTDNADDLAFEAAITSASRAIDHECGRQFGSVPSSVARTYTVDPCLIIDNSYALAIDDLHSLTNLVVETDEDDSGDYATELTLNTDYALWPYNALADGKPYTHLLTKSSSFYSWPRYPNSIRVTGMFGWGAVPSVVASACLIQAARFFVRRDSSYGIAGSPELGNELRLLARLDPDVALLLTSVKRWWAAA